MINKFLLTAICVFTISSNLVAQQTGFAIDQRDGKKFKTVLIDGQIWTSENLDVSRFRNGDLIPEVKTNAAWKNAGINHQPAWCYYGNSAVNGKKYGRLYNFYAVSDKRGLAPEGWHIANSLEWKSVTNFLGGGKDAGIKMKAISGWSGGANGNNKSGLNLLASSDRYGNGEFWGIGKDGAWWSPKETGTEVLHFYTGDNLIYVHSDFSECCSKETGNSVRCIKDNDGKSLIGQPANSSHQNKVFKTTYLRINDGEVDASNFSFMIENNILSISDLDHNTKDVYGAIKQDESGIDEFNNYFENYKSDIKDDALGFLMSGKKLRLYHFLYDKKNGVLLFIVEAIADETQNLNNSKTYFTEAGNDKLNGGNGISTASAELSQLLLKATKLEDIASVIEATYKKQGEKDYTTNKEAYSCLYKKNQWWSALLTYSADDNSLVRILFFLDKNSANYISKNSFKNSFTAVLEDGETKWVNSKAKISYELMPDSKTGIIRILYVD